MNRIAYLYFILLVCLIPSGIMAEEKCEPCSPGQQNQELIQMYNLYRDAVNDARNTGYQCGSDPDYVDYGPLKTKPGNCADWARVSWGALVTRTWTCWKVVKVRARKQFRFLHHNFVYIEPKCGGPRIYLDPWDSGRPDVYVGDAFPFGSGFLGWIHYPVSTHNAGDSPRDPNK